MSRITARPERGRKRKRIGDRKWGRDWVEKEVEENYLVINWGREREEEVEIEFEWEIELVLV